MGLKSLSTANDLKYFFLATLVILMFLPVSATEIESGYIQASSTGTISEEIGFRPDYIEFISAQQIESLNFAETDPQNNDCNDNVNGWSEGSVIFDDSGVEKQFSIGMFRNSDSTNAHTTAASNSHVIRNIYTEQGQFGGSNYECGRLQISVSGVDSNGFDLNIENKYDYNEIVRYKAYQFPDNMEFDAGMVEIDSSNTGSIDVDSLGFQPANLHIRAGQQITSKNSVSNYWRAPAGRSKGYATLDSDGNVIDQQSIGTASSSDSTNRHRSLASDQHVLNTVYVDQDANVLGRLEGVITGADSNGFDMNIEQNSFGSDEIFLYRAWGQSYYEYDVGYKVINSRGSQNFDTSFDGQNFEPDAIDIYAEQQISSINNELKTNSNDGCDNAGGWSNGFYETDDYRQWAISTGRTSASQNTHRYGSTTSEALLNLYRGGSGERDSCGQFTGEVTGTDSDGFDMYFDFNSDFENNYGEEMVYYRALNFLLAPPQAENIRFRNYTDQHSFNVTANFSEGSNDIDTCEITAEDNKGNSITYDKTDGVEAVKISDTKSKCVYDRIRYDDNPEWEERHNESDQLLKLKVNVTAEDVDDQSDTKVGYNTFPNTGPWIDQLKYSNYTTEHAFNTTAEISDQDSINPQELKKCLFNFSDDDGNWVSESGDINYSFGSDNQAACKYSNVNSSMPQSSSPGFEVLEEINVEATLNDSHGKQDSMTGTHIIPNNLPSAYDPNPSDGAIVQGNEDQEVYVGVEVSDPEDDPLRTYYYNDSGDFIGKVETTSGVRTSVLYPDSKISVTHDWYVKVGDTFENYTSDTFNFTKTTRRVYRTQPRIQHKYSSVILDDSDTRTINFKVENKVARSKNLTTYISGPQATFAENQEKSISYELEGNSQKEFLIIINPDSTGENTLNLTTENQVIGVNTTSSIPVTVKNYVDVSEVSEVSGIGTIQLIMLLLVSAYLYSARL